jgi:hypothetical protein
LIVCDDFIPENFIFLYFLSFLYSFEIYADFEAYLGVNVIIMVYFLALTLCFKTRNDLRGPKV